MPGIAVFGVAGRMGQCLVRALRAVPHELHLSGALASASSARLGEDAALEGPPCGIRITADLHAALEGAGAAVDFSLPQSVGEHTEACVALGVPLLVGATGLDSATRVQLEAAARTVPVLIAPNTSLGVAVRSHALGLAARALGDAYDAEISEAHHRFKRDAPSGTALALGEAIARARGLELEQVAVFDRHGTSAPRKPGSIGFSVIRAGDIVGEHTATFAGAGERIEMTHRATDRMVFARGALTAAAWLVGRPPGLYGMPDVLGFERA
jgi:4-hydroxy-tetrahydrodipicolinate reductase